MNRVLNYFFDLSPLWHSGVSENEFMMWTIIMRIGGLASCVGLICILIAAYKRNPFMFIGACLMGVGAMMCVGAAVAFSKMA